MRPNQVAEELTESVFTELNNWKEFEEIFDQLEPDEQEAITDTIKSIIEDILIQHDDSDSGNDED